MADGLYALSRPRISLQAYHRLQACVEVLQAANAEWGDLSLEPEVTESLIAAMSGIASCEADLGHFQVSQDWSEIAWQATRGDEH